MNKEQGVFDYMNKFVKGKSNGVSYSRLKNILNILFPEDKFTTKDTCRAFVNKVFESSDETLISTATTVFVAETKEEINECAARLYAHALGELRRVAKLRKIPFETQLKLTLEEVE